MFPTDSTNSPNAVFRVSNATVVNSVAAIHVVNGSVRKWPLPMKFRYGSSNVMIVPSVISCAMPRPATISTSVATIGWMPQPAVRKPFQMPQIVATASASRIASMNAVTSAPSPANTKTSRDMTMTEAAAAPAIAITEPTEMSTPPVAMTGVMPVARMTTLLLWFKMSMRLP